MRFLDKIFEHDNQDVDVILVDYQMSYTTPLKSQQEYQRRYYLKHQFVKCEMCLQMKCCSLHFYQREIQKNRRCQILDWFVLIQDRCLLRSVVMSRRMQRYINLHHLRKKYSSVSFVQCMDYPGEHNTVCTTQPVISTVGISVRCFLEKKGKASEPSNTVI